MKLTFFCPGRPVPQGSTRAFVVTSKATGRPMPVITHDNPQTRPWREAVGYAARQAMQQVGAKMTTEAVSISATFLLPRPKRFLAGAPLPRHTKRPDSDKLLRSALDALSGIVFSDDSVVDRITVLKRYTGGDRPGVQIEVEMEAKDAP